jgi:hypothetical protein
MSNLLGFIGKTRTARATCTAAFGRPGSLICNNCDRNCDQNPQLGGPFKSDGGLPTTVVVSWVLDVFGCK